MATSSITAPFTAKAVDFYKAVAKAEKYAEKRKMRPAPQKVQTRKMTAKEGDELLRRYE